ncbi:MAG: hypothetical protein ACXWJS_06935 [Hyphomicrobium sp.]
MRILSSPDTGLLLLALATSGPALATERLTMPFNCQFDGERVQMRPSEDRSYEVYGRHERDIYTACSPVDPTRCRSWHMHRFDFSCSGVRVPWIDAAAAGARAIGRDAWVEGGSFHLAMGPMWTNDRPTFGRPGWWRNRYQRNDYGADDGARVVTLPPGYAPALGIPVMFTGTPEDEVAQAFPPATVTRTAPPAHEKIPALPERAPRKQEAPPASVPAAVATTAPAAAPAPATQVAAIRDAANAAPAAAVPGSSVTPTIINGPGAASGPAASPSPPLANWPAKSASPDEKPELRVAASETTSAETAAKDASTAPVAGPAPTETASLPTPAAYDQKTTVMLAAAAAVLLSITGLAVSALWSWARGPKRLPPPSTRDIASISLDGAPKGTSVSLSPHVGAAPPAVQAPPQLLPGNAGLVSPDDLPMPTTYAEALELLGAAPDASLAAVKKIVDGMRQSWHPDLARSEADRRVRQRRMQQINVAWDLVSQRRTAA